MAGRGPQPEVHVQLRQSTWRVGSSTSICIIGSCFCYSPPPPHRFLSMLFYPKHRSQQVTEKSENATRLGPLVLKDWKSVSSRDLGQMEVTVGISTFCNTDALDLASKGTGNCSNLLCLARVLWLSHVGPDQGKGIQSGIRLDFASCLFPWGTDARLGDRCKCRTWALESVSEGRVLASANPGGCFFSVLGTERERSGYSVAQSESTGSHQLVFPFCLLLEKAPKCEPSFQPFGFPCLVYFWKRPPKGGLPSGQLRFGTCS